MTERLPTGFATYAGDQQQILDEPWPKGPNTFGELLWPVTAEYDAAADRTRVGFSLIAPTGGCPCCASLGALPDTGTREVYDAAAGRMVPVRAGQMAAGDVVQQMCDQCVVAAVLSGGANPHPHPIWGRGWVS